MLFTALHAHASGILESYSDSAHLATYGGQTSVVDKNVFACLIWKKNLSQNTSNQVIIGNTRIFCNILRKLIIWLIDFNEKADRIIVAWDLFHWVHLKMVAPTSDCKWMVIGQNWVDPIERSRTLYSSMHLPVSTSLNAFAKLWHSSQNSIIL